MDDRYLDHTYRLAGRTIDPVAGTVVYAGQHGSLSRKQLEVLALLASTDRTVSREEFIHHVWDDNELVGDRGLTNAIYALRRSLRDSDTQQPLIRTIPRRGYQLHADVQLSGAEQDPSFVKGWPVPGRPGWRLQRLISRTDLAETWRAVEATTGRQRIFRFSRNEEHRRRLRREVAVLRTLRETLADHRESVAGVVDWRLDEPPYFLEMEATAHGSLADWSTARGGLHRIPLGERLRLLAQAASALHTLHDLGVAHRDISPSSLLVDQERGRPIVKLAELGLCHAESLGSSTAESTLGSALSTARESPYRPPEQRAVQAPDAAGDVFALGLLTFQVVVGDWHRPLNAESLEAVEPPELREILADCVAERPQNRPSAQDLSRRLHESLATVTDEGVTKSGFAESGADESGAAHSRTAPISLRPAHEEVGQSIGPFRLLEVLGEGGMGTVYLASQRYPIERQVALKLIKVGLDSDHILARFEAERQALALMDHDNVAAVYDAGSFAGRPYFVMEPVPGLDLIAHSDHSRLALRARIELFLQVCHGVSHAHQKGLIHRDLKPSNILVRKHAGQPATVKIIDFGVAKSLPRKLSTDTIHTRHGTLVGTPRYSSPEQISDHLPDVDTRSDIYSMGVVLYELVTGVTPHSAEELSGKSPGELAKILDSDPPTPHTRFSGLDPQKKTEIADRRSRSSAELEQRLASDLSWIILSCLERDPDDRYASVLELRADLERWLDGRPIDARPATGFYRAAKFIRRHRTAVTVAATVTVLLLTTTTLGVLGFLRSEAEAAKSRVAVIEAERAALEAEKAAEFQVRQFRSVDPSVIAAGIRRSLRESVREQAARHGPRTADEAQQQLDRLLQGVSFTDLVAPQFYIHFFDPALREIEAEYHDFPLLQARLWQASAETIGKWGRLASAVEPQDSALSTRQTLLGVDDPSSLVSLRKRGNLRHALGQLEEAEADLRAATAGLREVLGERAPETLDATFDLGHFLSLNGEFVEAEKLLRIALEGRRQVLGPRHADTLTSLSTMATLMVELGRMDEAETLHRQALTGSLEVLGENHITTLGTINGLGGVLLEQGKFSETEELARRALAISRQLFGEEHEATMIVSGNLAKLLGTTGQLDEAERLGRKALEGLIRLFGEGHPRTLVATDRLGGLLAKKGQLEEAEVLLRRAIQGQRDAFGNDHPRTLTAVQGLATTLRKMGRLNEAEQCARESLEGLRRSLGDEHNSTLKSLHELAAIRLRQGRLDEAESLQSHALEAQKRALGAEHPDTLLSLRGLGDILRARGEREEAGARYREALQGQERVLGAGSPEVVRTRERLTEL